jgi:hypothetical protein
VTSALRPLGRGRGLRGRSQPAALPLHLPPPHLPDLPSRSRRCRCLLPLLLPTRPGPQYPSLFAPDSALPKRRGDAGRPAGGSLGLGGGGSLAGGSGRYVSGGGGGPGGHSEMAGLGGEGGQLMTGTYLVGGRK